MQHDWCPYKKRRSGHRQAQGKTTGDHRGRRPSRRQVGRPHRTPTLTAP